MINIEDQEALLKLVAEYLDEDIECVAIGGTAMMFEGYKTATKDIDLVFSSLEDRNIFIKAIEKLGYSQKSLKLVYDLKRLQKKNVPLLYSRGDERFDLFVKDVFGFDIDFKKFIQKHEYIGRKELIIYTVNKELLILLKAITNREKDYEDIETILSKEKNVDWGNIVDEAILRRNKISWILIDLEEKMLQLKKKTLIKKEYFDRIYKAEAKAK